MGNKLGNNEQSLENRLKIWENGQEVCDNLVEKIIMHKENER